MSKEKMIAVIGLGYVGLPLAVEFGKQRAVIGRLIPCQEYEIRFLYLFWFKKHGIGRKAPESGRFSRFYLVRLRTVKSVGLGNNFFCGLVLRSQVNVVSTLKRSSFAA